MRAHIKGFYRFLTALAVFGVLVAIGVSAEEGVEKNLSLSVDYNVPVGNDKVDANLSFGAQYRFWEVFEFTGAMYTDIVYGAENILNIKKIEPLGLFSWGFGMKIPMGDFKFALDWLRLYTGTISEEEVYAFCDSYKLGLNFDLSNTFGVEFYSRRLFNFSDEAVSDENIRIADSEDTVQMIGVGAVFYLF